MKKHLFTVRWERDGTRAYATFERLFSFNWPDTLPDNEHVPVMLKARAKVLGMSELEATENMFKSLPDECQQALEMLQGMRLRSRFSPETQGPYLIDDPEEVLTPERLLTFVTFSEDRLKAYRV